MIAEVLIDPRGGGCSGPLAPGRYRVGFEVDLVDAGLVTCGQEAEVTVGPTPRSSRETRTCPPQPACGLACPGGSFARDENGCTLCACEEHDLLF